MKRTTLIARIICMVLMICMLASAFVACTKEDEKDPVKTNGSTQSAGPETDEEGFLKDGLPDLNLNREVDILYSVLASMLMLLNI